MTGGRLHSPSDSHTHCLGYSEFSQALISWETGEKAYSNVKEIRLKHASANLADTIDPLYSTGAFPLASVIIRPKFKNRERRSPVS